MDALWVLLAVPAYVVLMRWVLPRFGVATWPPKSAELGPTARR